MNKIIKYGIFGFSGLFLLLIGIYSIADSIEPDIMKPTIITEKYDGNCNVDMELYCYDPTNHIQAPHFNVDYYVRDNVIYINDSKIENFNGDSMQPTIWTGNKLIVTEYKKGMQLKEGMIIGYRRLFDDSFTTHRIKTIYNNEIYTQGDNNLKEDEPIQKSQIKYIILGVLFL